jgi:hypothetical protein
MDMHFPTDLMVYVGYSRDYALAPATAASVYDIPVISAMSIALPEFKWTMAAVDRLDERFSDVDISEDGLKVMVAGSDSPNRNFLIIWVLNAADGAILSQRIAKLAGSPIVSNRLFKQAIVASGSSTVYILVKTRIDDSNQYLAAIDYLTTPGATSVIWTLKTTVASPTTSASSL